MSDTTLIKVDEIKELRRIVEGTEAEELVNKLHRSYNAMFILVNDLKRDNENFRRY